METVTLTLFAGLFGAIGGIIRASLGLFKALSFKRKIFWANFALTVIVSALIGLMTGIIFSFDYRLSILAGYAGTDILEGIYKSFKVEKVYVKEK
jgi:fluoride ion exporter CrcB/FEX